MSEAAEQNNSHQAFIGRQPIFDVDLNLHGYELLFRSGEHSSAGVTDGNQATSQVIINAFVDIGIEQITGNNIAFINLTRDFLVGKIPLPFESGNIVLEILEDVHADEETIAAVTELSKKGFIIALDDFVISDKNRALIPLADIVKVDLMQFENDEALRSDVEELKKHSVKLLAEKVETREEFELCKTLGFELFQGYFFCKPQIITGKKLPANRIALLNLIAKLQSPDCDIKELEELISRDVAISYKLMRIINSPFYGLRTKIESVQRALMVLGLKALKSWVTVISLSMIDNKPPELVNTSLIRAKMCEQLSSSFNCSEESSFTVGLFSLLEALMDQPLTELLSKLPLSSEICAALLQHKGELGQILDVVIAYEHGDWETVEKSKLDSGELRQAFLTSLSWAGEISLQMSTPTN